MNKLCQHEITIEPLKTLENKINYANEFFTNATLNQNEDGKEIIIEKRKFPRKYEIGKFVSLKVGDKFNKLTIHKYEGNSKWNCKCDCGKFTVVKTNALKTGRIKSCGCNWKNSHYKHRLPDEEAMENVVYCGYRLGAKKRGMLFELSKETFRNLIREPCHYCGSLPSSKFNKPKLKQSYPNFKYNGVDRIDNKRGYILDNCVTCCNTCNLAKRKMSLDEFKNWINKAYNHLFIKYEK